MSKPHKHAKLIKAWADGAKIQWFDATKGKWYPSDNPLWKEEREYRVKPEPKPDVVVYARAEPKQVFACNGTMYVGDNLKLVFDGESGKLKSAEVLE